jgi:hypothetical protein
LLFVKKLSLVFVFFFLRNNSHLIFFSPARGKKKQNNLDNQNKKGREKFLNPKLGPHPWPNPFLYLKIPQKILCFWGPGQKQKKTLAKNLIFFFFPKRGFFYFRFPPL